MQKTKFSFCVWSRSLIENPMQTSFSWRHFLIFCIFFFLMTTFFWWFLPWNVKLKCFAIGHRIFFWWLTSELQLFLARNNLIKLNKAGILNNNSNVLKPLNCYQPNAEYIWNYVVNNRKCKYAFVIIKLSKALLYHLFSSFQTYDDFCFFERGKWPKINR